MTLLLAVMNVMLSNGCASIPVSCVSGLCIAPELQLGWNIKRLQSHISGRTPTISR
jgi:hypothetical protein